MTSREQILSAIQANQPEWQPLPDVFQFESSFSDLTQQFSDVLTFVGGKAVVVPDYDAIRADLNQQFPDIRSVGTTIPELADLADTSLDVHDPHDLAGLNLAIIAGELGVAENAAIWVDETHTIHRALPMITQYLVIVMRRSALVPNMHDAYRKIQVDRTGFGTFICGPSKTADIEQSLVIGAHGARSLTVYLLP